MSKIIYRYPEVDPEVLEIISKNYMIDIHNLVVLSKKEHHSSFSGALPLLTEGYIACTLTGRQTVFWYQMTYKNEWKVNIIPYAPVDNKIKDAIVNLVYGEPMPKLKTE